MVHKACGYRAHAASPALLETSAHRKQEHDCSYSRHTCAPLPHPERPSQLVTEVEPGPLDPLSKPTTVASLHPYCGTPTRLLAFC